MIILAALALGIFWGYRSAKTRGGDIKDKLQYAFVYGMLFAVIGLMITIVIHRLAS